MESATSIDELDDPVPAAHSAPDAPARTPALVTAVGEECPRCGSNLATDQRYCVECGERRGEPRLPFMDGRTTAAHAHAAAAPTAGGDRAHRMRMTVNGTLIAGVGTLLLAMGTGVLIGRSSNDSAAKSSNANVPVITVNGAAAGTAAAAGAAGAGAADAARKAAKSSKAKAASGANEPLKATKKAGKLPPAKVKVGSPGKGRGYKNGKFTGDFFGP